MLINKIIKLQLITWPIHIMYLRTLLNWITDGTRGSRMVNFTWLLTFLFSINYARTNIDDYVFKPHNLQNTILMAVSISQMIVQVSLFRKKILLVFFLLFFFYKDFLYILQTN